MIQRIQTVYLLLSAIAMTVCLFLTIGIFDPVAMGTPQLKMYNLCITGGQEMNFVCAGLFVALVASVILSVLNIFGYKNRRKQSRQCLMTIIILLLWIGGYTIITNALCPEGYTFHPQYIATAFPIVAIILQWLARRGILADERLVRSEDRIR